MNLSLLAKRLQLNCLFWFKISERQNNNYHLELSEELLGELEVVEEREDEEGEVVDYLWGTEVN